MENWLLGANFSIIILIIIILYYIIYVIVYLNITDDKKYLQ